MRQKIPRRLITVSGIFQARMWLIEILAPESAKTQSQETELLSPDDDEMLVSQAFKFFMNIQLTLILFLALSWLYDHV
jgi:hypothetical protein